MKKYLFSVIFTLFILFPSLSSAHPHSWINMKTNVLIENRQLIGFKMEWQLDEIASSELIYEMKISDNESETREKITQEMVQTAILNHYFSYLYDEQNQPIKYTTHPKNTYFEITDNRVTFHIHFYLTHPQQVQDRIFKLFTYEPSYYISMSYEDENALLISDSDHLCKLHLNPPNVDTEIQQYAMDLDRTQTPDQDLSLGAQFAQEVKIVCKK